MISIVKILDSLIKLELRYNSKRLKIKLLKHELNKTELEVQDLYMKLLREYIRAKSLIENPPIENILKNVNKRGF